MLQVLGRKAVLAASAAVVIASPAIAEPTAALQLNPIADVRLRIEDVHQPGLDGSALTLRARAGAEAKTGRLALLAEAEATVAPLASYNAFPFVIADDQRRPANAVVADPRNFELNRLQLQYVGKDGTLTVGRQRINLDDQRWVGSVGWRQNEQTFDAVRAEAKQGPVTADLTYAISQRTIFGEEAGARTSYDGQFVFAGAGSKLGPLQAKLFAYLLDYRGQIMRANSSQTYGFIANSAIPLRRNTKLSLRGSYARQSDYRGNPFHYAAPYVNAEAGLSLNGFALLAGWEKLGSDNGRAVQTPMATLHKFNGWADMFLTTPANGLEDAYVSVVRNFGGVKALPGLNTNFAYHQFDSAKGNVEYGTEWDASIGFKIGKIGVLLKYARYKTKGFGVDTRKLWLQSEWAY